MYTYWVQFDKHLAKSLFGSSHIVDMQRENEIHFQLDLHLWLGNIYRDDPVLLHDASCPFLFLDSDWNMVKKGSKKQPVNCRPVSQAWVICKLMKWHMREHMCRRSVLAQVIDFLTSPREQVRIWRQSFDWSSIWRGVPQGGMLGLALLFIFMDDLAVVPWCRCLQMTQK